MRESEELAHTRNPRVWKILYKHLDDGGICCRYHPLRNHREPRYDKGKNHRRDSPDTIRWHCRLCKSRSRRWNYTYAQGCGYPQWEVPVQYSNRPVYAFLFDRPYYKSRP
jgi:hypothetical protein